MTGDGGRGTGDGGRVIGPYWWPRPHSPSPPAKAAYAAVDISSVAAWGRAGVGCQKVVQYATSERNRPMKVVAPNRRQEYDASVSESATLASRITDETSCAAPSALN